MRTFLVLAAFAVGSATGHAQNPVSKSAAPLVDCSKQGPWSVTAVGEAVYWVNFKAGTIVRSPLGGGATEVVASGQKNPCAIATDGLNLFWTNRGDGTVAKMPLVKNASSTVQILARSQRNPGSISAGPGMVHWMTDDGAKSLKLSMEPVFRHADWGRGGGGENPGTIKCSVCPIYCEAPQIGPDGKVTMKTYICGWQSCPPCGA